MTKAMARLQGQSPPSVSDRITRAGPWTASRPRWQSDDGREVGGLGRPRHIGVAGRVDSDTLRAVFLSTPEIRRVHERRIDDERIARLVGSDLEGVGRRA